MNRQGGGYWVPGPYVLVRRVEILARKQVIAATDAWVLDFLTKWEDGDDRADDSDED